MVASLRQLVTVQPGGVVRIQSDQLKEGAVAEVVITTNAGESQMSWNEFIGIGEKPGRSVAEIDAYIRELRDEWP